MSTAVAAAVEVAMALHEDSERPESAGRGFLQHPGSWRDAVRRDWRELRVAPLAVRSDKEAVLGAVHQDERAFAAASDRLKGDKDFVMQVVAVRGEALRHAAPELRDDTQVVLQAVGQDRCALRHASEALRADITVAAEAMRRRPVDPHLFCATEELQIPADTAREATHTLDASIWRRKVARDWRRLEEAPANVKADREQVSDAIDDSWGEALRHTSVELQGDKALVLKAVRIRGRCLQYASEELRNDVEVVHAAVNQEWESIVFAGEAPRSDLGVMEEAVKQSADALEYASEVVRGNRDFMLRCVGADGLALRFAAEELRNDPDIALAAFKKNNLALRWIGDSAREFVWASTRELEYGYRRTATRWIDVEQPAAIADTPAVGVAISEVGDAVAT